MLVQLLNRREVVAPRSSSSSSLSSTSCALTRYLWTHLCVTECQRIVNSRFAADIYNVRYSPNGQQVVALLSTGQCILTDPHRMKQRQHTCAWPAHNDGVNVCDFLDGNVLVTGGDDGMVKVWDTRQLSTCVHHMQHVPRYGVKNVQWLSDQIILSSSMDGGRVYLWNTITNQTTTAFPRSHLIRTRAIRTVNSRKYKLAMTTRRGTFIEPEFDPQQLLLDNSTYQPSPASAAAHTVECSMGDDDDDEATTIRIAISAQVHPSGGWLLLRAMQTFEDDEVGNDKLLVYDVGSSAPQSSSNVLAPACTIDDAPSRFLIREPAWSSCGQYMASPYYRGVRVFRFDQSNGQLKSLTMSTNQLINTHRANVLSVAFHPFWSPVFVTCGSDGKMTLYQPQ